MEDESGYARYSYDAMGNASENCRTFALAAEDNAYTFIMNTEYDTWGRTLSITYPDKERVSYAYDFGGNLKSVSSAKNGNDKSLVDSIRYDKFGDRTAVYFGNGTTQYYSYNPTSRRLGNLRGRTATNALMQDIIYEYDAVGNVTKTDNAAVAIGTLGGPYSCAYTYDHLNRLTATNCQQGNVGYTEQRTYLDDGRIATYDLNGTRRGYSYNTTQPHTLSNIHTLPNRASDVLFSFGWDAKGNMTAQNSQGGSQRNLVWDERNRMLGMVDNAASGNAAHYVYDAQGERSFKLTGYSNHTGADETSETYVTLDEPTLYASPYLTATATGYTKHYFAGTERLASAIGNGGLADIGQPIVDGDVLADKLRERDTVLFRVMEPYPLRINRNRLDTLYSLTRPDTTAELTYFFHPDHLGSASWITDLSGQPVQHLQYKPFGGDYIDQQAPGTDYSERFRFIGKERDAETGYDYFGGYYSSSLGIWLSVDPMSDKYPSLSPYVYCADNPVNAFDPDGMDWVDADGNKIEDHSKIKAYIFYDPRENGFAKQSKEMYNQLEAKYGKGSVAMSNATTTEEFTQDWGDMASPNIREVNLNYHGNNQTVMLNSDEGQYITATGDGKTNRSETKAINVQDLPMPLGNIDNAQLNLNTCQSNNRMQYELKGNKQTLMEAFYNSTTYKTVRGTSSGVSYDRKTKQPFPGHSYRRGTWDYMNRPKQSLPKHPRIGLPPK